MRWTSIDFVWFVIASGVLCLFFIIGNLGVLGLHREPLEPRKYISESNIGRGQVLVGQYGCGSCHVIPGVAGASGRVGPKLQDIRQQTFIAGVLPNTPQNMARWIREPQMISPRTAMPNLDISEEEAMAMAEFLYSR